MTSLQQEDRPPLLQDLAYRGHLGEDARCFARAGARSYGQRSPAQCRSRGQSAGEDHWRGRRRAWLRWRQEGEGHSKRHLLVDTQGLVLKAKVHAANIMDWEGIKVLLQRAEVEFPRLKHLWLDAGYRGENKGKDWVEKALGGAWSSSSVRASLLLKRCSDGMGRGVG
jgi:hypothetical protein